MPRNSSLNIGVRPAALRCTPHDLYNSILYEHELVARASAVAHPQGTLQL
jgi:hypothetical protein